MQYRGSAAGAVWLAAATATAAPAAAEEDGPAYHSKPFTAALEAGSQHMQQQEQQQYQQQRARQGFS